MTLTISMKSSLMWIFSFTANEMLLKAPVKSKPKYQNYTQIVSHRRTKKVMTITSYTSWDQFTKGLNSTLVTEWRHNENHIAVVITTEPEKLCIMQKEPRSYVLLVCHGDSWMKFPQKFNYQIHNQKKARIAQQTDSSKCLLSITFQVLLPRSTGDSR